MGRVATLTCEPPPYARTRAETHTHTHTHTYAHTRTHTKNTHTCTTHKNTHTCTRTRMHTRAHAQSTHTHTQAHTHAHAHTRTRTRTSAHTIRHCLVRTDEYVMLRSFFTICLLLMSNANDRVRHEADAKEDIAESEWLLPFLRRGNPARWLTKQIQHFAPGGKHSDLYNGPLLGEHHANRRCQ